MNFEFSILDFLSKDDFIVYNKKLAHTIGINETILFMDLVSKYRYFLNKWWIDEEGYFYNTSENIQKDTALTQFQQQKSLKSLIKLWFISTKLKWLPSTKHFRINFDTINSLFKPASHHSFQQSWKLVCNKVENKFSTNWKTTLQQSWKQVFNKVETNNNKNKNKNKKNEWMYTHPQNSFLLEWNSIMDKMDVLTPKISKHLQTLNLPLEEFIRRCKNFQKIVYTIKENKLQKYVFYKVSTYDFGKFLDNINIFEGSIEDILERIVDWNDSFSLNKIKKYINPNPQPSILESKEESIPKPSLLDLEKKVKSILPNIGKDTHKQLLERFIKKVESNKILSLYYQKGWMENSFIKGMYYTFILEEVK